MDEQTRKERKAVVPESEENLKMRLFIANYMLKNPKASRREIRRATEKEFKTKIQ